MSSKFAQAATFAKLPAVCIKPRPNLPTAYVDAIPKGLTAMAYWLDVAAEIEISDSFPIHYDDSLPGWTGASTKTALVLSVTILIMPAANTYDFHLEVSRDGVRLDDDSWHNVFVDPAPPWNSGPLKHVWAPGFDQNGLWVMN